MVAAFMVAGMAVAGTAECESVHDDFDWSDGTVCSLQQFNQRTADGNESSADRAIARREHQVGQSFSIGLRRQDRKFSFEFIIATAKSYRPFHL